MKYENIMLSFTSPEKMEELINEIKPIFDLVDDYGQQILQNIMSTIDEFIEAKTKLVGAVMILNPILSAAMTAKRNEMLHYYVAQKREIENKEPQKDEKGRLIKEKFVAGATETEAEESVADFRRIRNIIQGYINSAWAGINDCESRIIGKRTEYKKTE